MTTLLNPEQLLDYENVTAEQALQAIEASITRYQQGIQRVIAHQALLPTWDDLVLAVDALDADLQGTFYSFVPMFGRDAQWAAVINETYKQVDHCFKDKLKNAQLHELYSRLADSAIGQNLDRRKKATLAYILQDYELGGVHLSSDQQTRLQQIEKQLGELQGQFQSNFRDSVESLSVHVTDERQLQGISAYHRTQMREKAQAASLPGWLIICDQANYTTVLKHAQERVLREQIYRAYKTRGASDDPARDNGAVIQTIAQLREEKAHLLGFENYVQLSLQTKSIGTEEDLQALLTGLEAHIRPVMDASNKQLEPVAAAQGIDTIRPWDIEYLHALGRSDSSLTDALMQEYFPFERVLTALIDLARCLFGVELQEIDAPKAWHGSVSAFKVIKDHANLGYLYLDALQHEYKAPDTVQTISYWHRRVDAEGRFHGAVAAVFSDIPPGADDLPPLLDHLALKKLFHEFGHALHTLLAQTNNHLLSDPRRLGNDGVEVVAKLFECWVWNADYLASISSHYQSGQSLGSAQLQALLTQLQADSVRVCADNLSLALLDIDLHLSPADGRNLSQRVEENHERTGQLPLAGFEQPLHGFDYLVAGYDAGFFAYLWAEVHAWDLFSRFEAAGLRDARVGRALLEALFAPAASRRLSQSVEAFLGRPVDMTRFLKWNGLT